MEPKNKVVEQFMKKNKSKIYELQLIDGKPQMVCSVCGGKSFTFVTGFFFFFFAITTFYRICDTCGKKNRHGGAIN
jgi:hypothetical protein